MLALVNIVGHGIRGGEIEQNRSDMETAPTAALARDHADVVVGIKTAHHDYRERGDARWDGILYRQRSQNGGRNMAMKMTRRHVLQGGVSAAARPPRP